MGTYERAEREGPPLVPEELEVGYSTCPNDTFIFHALVTGLVPTAGVTWRPILEDVETLNRWAFERRIPVTKISFHAYGHLRESHVLLASGAALGRGCGPLLIAREPSAGSRLERGLVAIPGRWTSAALLLRLFAPGIPPERLVEMRFDRIVASVARGEVDAGVIIHESRFTYSGEGLVSLADLGEWWEGQAGLPVPLGGILADRRLGPARIRAIEGALRESVRHARRRPEESAGYVRAHAQEMRDDVIRAHIGLYVNDFTEDLGEEGLRAVRALFRTAEDRGILPRYNGEITVGEQE